MGRILVKLWVGNTESFGYNFRCFQVNGRNYGKMLMGNTESFRYNSRNDLRGKYREFWVPFGKNLKSYTEERSTEGCRKDYRVSVYGQYRKVWYQNRKY